MPVFYRETVIDPENSQKSPYKQQQQSFYESNGQQHPYQQSKTSYTYPGSERSSGIYKRNGSSSANTTTTATDFPANFPKIPPPKGVIDDKQLERMAEQLMKGQQPTWDGQQYSPPGWTRHSQQSYTIETVVEHEPETRPIYVGKHYESVPPKTGIPPQTHPKHQYSPSQHMPPKTTKQPPPLPSSQIYRQPQPQEKYNYQPTEQQYYSKTVQQKQQIPPLEQQKQFPPQQQQQKYFPLQQVSQQQKPAGTIKETTEEKKSTSVVDSTNFPSQQYTKTLTEYRQQTKGYDSPKKEGAGEGGLQQVQKQQMQEPRQEEWKQQKITNTTQQSPQNKIQSQQKQWESIQSPHEKWKWSQTQQWNSQQQPQQTQQQWEQQTLQWQQAQQQPAEQWGQSQQQWQQAPQQTKEKEEKQSHQWQQQQTQKYTTQQQQNLLKQRTQQQQSQQYSPQKAQNELKQQTTVQAQQSQNLSGTSKAEQKESREQKIEQDVGDEYDGPPPDLQLAQADPDKIYEKQHEVYQNGWQQEEDYNQQPYRSHHLNQRQLQQTRNNYDEPLYISAGGDDGYQQQYHQYYSPNSQIYWDSVYNDEWALRGANPPSFTTGPVWGDHLAYAQRMNLEKRRTESEKQRRHHTPVPGSAEYGYLFGGMDFVDHNNFDPSINVGEPFNEMQERHSRRDLHWGPPRRRGDFFGLDYRTMLPEEEQHRSHSAEDSAFYQGYQALPPRKNFRLVGHFTADHNAPLNIAEAQGLDEFDSQYWVGDTLSNQKVRPEYPLTEEEKRTFALLYGPGGFKPDHRTVIPEPKPEEPVQFSVTIGPKKEKKEQQPEGYVNPMKVEGESWMLGQRGEYDGQYGKILHSTAEQHLPFHRPKHFPARVPNWAVERQNQMGRGARSLDRSLFLPSWAKIPQPQPPFWVKRDGSKVAGNWQVPKQQQQSELQEKQQQFVQQQKSPSQQQKQQQQYVANQQIINSPQQKEENRLPQPSPTQPQQQPSPQQKQKTQQIQKLPSPTEQKQPQKEETDKNLQKSKQQIFTQSQQQSHPNYQQQTNVTTTTYTQNQQIQPPINTQHTQPEQKPLHQGFTSAPTAQNQQQFTQLIITPSKTHQTTFKPAKQPLTSSQEQQQQLKQQQQYSDFYEGGGQTQKSGPQQEQFKQFTSPGGQFYGQQKVGNGGKAPQQQYIVNQPNQPSGQYYGRMPQQQQQQYQYRMQQQHPQLHKGGGYTKTPQNYPQGGIVEEEEKSGLENLAKMKLGKFPMRESLEAQQSLESNNDPVDSSNIKRQQFIRSGQPGQVIREEWRFSSGQPQKGTTGGHQLLQSSTTTTTTTSSISGDIQ